VLLREININAAPIRAIPGRAAGIQVEGDSQGQMVTEFLVEAL
jgi:hypothetical protein